MAESLKTIPLDKIVPANDNLRTDPQNIQELADSIAFIGLLEPIVVQKDGDTYKIVAGERRYRAMLLNQMTETKAIVRTGLSEEQRQAAMLIENMQRVDLNVAEQAEGVRRLMQEHGFTQKQVAESLGVSTEWVKDRTSILNVDDVFLQRDERPLPTKHLALLGELSEDRRARLTKKESETPGSVGQYQVEEAINKQRSEDSAERLLKKLRKDSYLATTEKELKRLLTTDLAETQGLDQAIKLKMGAAEQIVTSSWERPEGSFLRYSPLHGSEWHKTISKNEIIVATKQGGYVSWVKATLETNDLADDEADDEWSRVIEANDKMRAQYKVDRHAAEVKHVADAKPAELTAAILRACVNQLESGYQAFHQCAEALDRLGGTPTPIDQGADIQAQRDAHAANYEALCEYAFKNSANLARAAATVEMLRSRFGNPFNVEYPEEPEYLALPDDDEIEELSPLEVGV